MSDPRPYSALSADEQAELSVWIEGFEQGYSYEGAAAFKKAVREAPEPLRPALVSQLLPSLIDQDRKRQGATPTLHELRARFPDLTAELTAAYPLLSDSYRLPVEVRGYRVLRVVGEGGQAVVLRAQDDVHSAVAIKLSASPQHNDLLLRERQLLGQCHHPGVPEVIGSGVVEDRAFFIMPFLRGMTLADKYASRRAAAAEAAHIGAELCGIVEHLHEQGILHRDIKPQNVWIDEQGAVKLIDLGMAIERSSWGARPAVQEFHGTPAYMSPEQATSDSENDGELSDVFSIGAVLYWMGAGAPPYGGGSHESVLTRAAEGQLERDRLQAVSGWPKGLSKLCLEALASDPADRVASAAQFGERLRSFAAQASTAGGKRSKPIAIVATLLIAAAAVVLARPYVTLPWNTATPAQPEDVAAAPAPEEETQAVVRWIGRAAQSGQIDLGSISSEQFTVGVNCRARLIEPWGEQPRGPNIYPELTLQLDENLAALAPALQYRIGESAWGTLSPTEETLSLTAPLSMVAAAGHGPVQVRLVTDPSGQPETAVGPFRYELDIARALKEDEQAFGQELIKEATTEKCFDVTQPGWAIREEYARRIDPIIEEFYFGVDREELTSVSFLLDKLAGRKKSPAGGRPGLGLREGFALVSNEVQDANQLWVIIQFSGGGNWGPVLYEKPLTEAQKDKQRVLEWFERLGPDDKLAQLTQTQFVLTRLNEIAPSLTHLHFTGTRRIVNGDPTHVKDSPSGDPKDNKIEERPSSEMVVDLARVGGDRTIEIPPTWSPVTVRGRFPDGTFTPSFEVYNAKMTLCCCSVSPFDVSSRAADRELYVYIQDDTAPINFLSIAPLLPNADRLPREVLDRCHRTRLGLASPLPEGAVGVEYYSDSRFKIKVETAQAGVIYARYVTADNESLGYSAYKLSEAFMRQWLEHALDHAKGAPTKSTYREARPSG